MSGIRLQTAASGNARQSTLLLSSHSQTGGRFTNVTVSNEHYYKEDSLIKKAA